MAKNYTYHRQLDGLRCIAVIGPLISHWMRNTIMDNLPFGFGVYMFFVLSGFLITNILLSQKEQIIHEASTIGKSYRNFIARRTIRIFPIYYITIFVFILLKGDVVIENVTWLLTYTINVKIFLTNDWVSYISHLWTLAVEEQFYIFFPLVIFLVPLKKLPALLISIIVLSMVSKNLYYFLYPDKVIASATFPLHSFDSLCMGALFSYVAKYHYDRFRKYLDMLIFWRLLLALFFYLLVFYYVDAPSYPVNNYVTRTVLAFVFSFLCMYLVGKAGTIGFKGIWGKMLDSAALVYIGKISYGIYLYHNFVPVLLNVVKIKTGISYNHIPTLPLVYLVVTIVLASLSWHLVERPINSLKDKFNYSS